MLSLDSTTFSEYDGAETPTAQIAAVLSALADPVTVRVYDGSNAVMGTGTMATPWATQDGSQLRLGALSSFTVGTTGTPNSGWYIRFESGSRWLRGAFGLKGASDVDFTWNLPTWQAGQTAIIGTATVSVIAAPTNNAPTWSASAPSSITLASGQTYNFAQWASDPDGDTLIFSKVSGPGEITSAGLYTVGAEGTVRIRVSDGASQVDRDFGVAYPAVSAEGRRMFTRFASNVSLLTTASYGSGGEQRLDGTDSVTGDVFTATNPTIWGGYNTSKASSASLQILKSGAANLSAALADFQIAFEAGVDGPFGSQRALRIRRTAAYDGLHQCAYQLYPNTSLTQGMFYVRGTVKFAPDFFTQVGGTPWFVALAEAKTSGPTECRTILQFVNWSSTGWRIQLKGERITGGYVSQFDIQTPVGLSQFVPADGVLKYEYAARYSYNLDGWTWAAINGQTTFGAVTLSQSGRNMYASDWGKINRIYPFLYYPNGPAGRDQYYLSQEVWDRWPDDASPHPNWS